MISIFGPSLENKAAGIADTGDLAVLKQIAEPHLPHSACLRAFAKLWESNAIEARQIYEQCLILALKS